MNDVKDKLKTVLEPIELPGDDPRSQIVEMILGLPLFQNLEMREADLLARFIKPCRVREDAVIFQEGEEGSFMGLVVEGLAEVSKENSGHEAVKVAAEGTGRMLEESRSTESRSLRPPGSSNREPFCCSPKKVSSGFSFNVEKRRLGALSRLLFFSDLTRT